MSAKKLSLPKYKNEILRYIQEELIIIYEKIQKYDKKNNLENLNKLENDLNEFWRVDQEYYSIIKFASFYAENYSSFEFIFSSFFEEVKTSTTNNIINDFLFHINFSKGEYISEPISMEFIKKLIDIKNKNSSNSYYAYLGANIKDINIEKDLHQQKNNVKEAIINVFNLTGLKTWSYRYFPNKVIEEEDIVSCNRMFPNLLRLFYKDKELDKRISACVQSYKPKSFWEIIKIKFRIFKEKNSKHRKVIRHGCSNGLPPAPPPPRKSTSLIN
jgi:hypothetical protein